jgi:hypothetical protein
MAHQPITSYYRIEHHQVNTSRELTEKYAQKIEPILPLAKRAYGLRGQDTPEHKASTKYTELVKDYYSKGGSLVALAERLGVAYSGLRRRVFASSIPPVARKARTKNNEVAVEKALGAVLKARDTSTEAYHRQLHKAYHQGVSLAKLAEGLKLSSSAPLYYAVQRQEIRIQEGE